jgi:hypothetical protein
MILSENQRKRGHPKGKRNADLKKILLKHGQKAIDNIRKYLPYKSKKGDGVYSDEYIRILTWKLKKMNVKLKENAIRNAQS